MIAPSLIPYHPNGLASEIAAMPNAYRAMVGDMIGNMKDFYSREIAALGGTAPNAMACVDDHARALIGARFPEHAVHYGYLPANDAKGFPLDAYVRMVGLVPPGNEPLRGTILDVRGYGHVFEYDLERAAGFLNAGFAVFTPDRMEHGLSSRIDPRNASYRSTQIFVEHTRQAAEAVAGLRERFPRLGSSPFYVLASSLGGTQLVAAMRDAGSSFGIRAMVLDSPLLTFGTKHPWWLRRLTAGLFGALATFPERLSEVKAFYPKRGAPARLPNMTNELFDRINRYSHAFGPRYHPIVMNGLEELLFGNERWMKSGAARILPRTLMTVAQSDTELSPTENTRLFRDFARPGDALRETAVHNAFVQRDDRHLIDDIVDFFEERKPDPARVFTGQEMRFFPWPKGNWL